MAFEVLYLQTGETPARLDRWWIDRIFSEGVSDVQAGELLVTAGPGLSVNIAAGSAVVQGDDVDDQGAYLARSTTMENRELPAPPAAGTSRIDLVVMRVRDSTATGGDPTEDGVAIEVIEGVADPDPSAPAAPDTALALAEWTVNAGQVQAADTDADAVDRRVQLNAETLDVGTQAIPLTTAERDALNDPGIGSLVYNTDTDALERYDGATWGSVAPADGARIVSGSYTGDGTVNRVIALPFTPKRVETRNNSNWVSVSGIGNNQYGLRVASNTAIVTSQNHDRPGLTDAGFIVSASGGTADLNAPSTLNYYVAIG